MQKAGVLILIILSVILGIRFFFFYQNQTIYKNGEVVKFETRLTEEPEILQGKQKFRVATPVGGEVNITTALHPIFQYGDTILIEGIITKKDYEDYTYTVINYPKLKIVQTEQHFLTASATSIRRSAKSLFEGSLPPISASLLSGIIFGGNQGISSAFLENLRTTGVVHVIAASGMNVTFVASALLFTLSKILKRKAAILLTMLGVLFYSFVAGFDPSIVRASIMAIIAFSASLFGRQNFAVFALFITAFIMLLFNPSNISDIGFQLSFLSTLGILIIKPVLPLSKNIFFSEDVGTTIAAQLATIPILLGVFGNYGMLSILVNALLLWTVPPLMIFGTLGLVVGLVIPILGKLILFLTIPILYFFEITVRYFGDLGYKVTIPEVSIFIWIGYYMILIAIILLIHTKRHQKSTKKKVVQV